MHKLLVATILCTSVLAGCLGDEDRDPTDTSDSGFLAEKGQLRLWLNPEAGIKTMTSNSASRSVQWTGACIETCPAFRLDLAEDPPLSSDERLEVLVQWDGQATAGFRSRLGGPSYELRTSQIGYQAERFQVWEASPGTYELLMDGTGDYRVKAAIVSIAPPAEDRLPNLVTLTPSDLSFGCSDYERSEQGAQRCLRLGNGVGNVGHGPLEVRLSLADGALAMAGLGQFVQRIYDGNGDFREEPVAGAQFHFTHSHFHYDGLASFSLYEFDLDTGLQGEQVGQDKKSGFCFIDIEPMQDSEVPSAPHRYGATGCFTPDPLDWLMGVSLGWYDYYDAGLDEQYVEVSGVPDGVYELVSTADGSNTLLETDEEDNAASVILRLTGDEIKVLHKRGFYHP